MAASLVARCSVVLCVLLGCSAPAEPRDPPPRANGPTNGPELPRPEASPQRLAHPRSTAVATAHPPSAFEDLDHDGHADLIVGRTEGPPPIELADVHLVGAEGIDVRPSEVIDASRSCGLGELPVTRLGDLDGDGLGELGVSRAAGHDASVTIVHGHARGAEAHTTQIDSPVRGAPSCFGQSIVSVDVDGDGHLDLVVGAPMTDAERGSVFVYRSTEAGAIPSAPTATIEGAVPGARFGTAIGVCDLVGDASPDLISGATEESDLKGTVYVLEGHAGSFASPGVRLASPDERSHRFGGRIASARDASGRCAALVGGLYGVHEIVRDASGPRLSSFHVAGERAPFALGDVTGDGAIEAIVCDGNHLRVHRRAETGFASEPITSIPTPAGDACVDLAVPGDLNADGRADVVAGILGHQSRPSRALIYYGAAGGLGAEALSLGAASGSMGFASWVR